MNTSESHVFSVYRTTVKDEWIDYNAHLSEAYYVLVFGFATDAAMDELGSTRNTGMRLVPRSTPSRPTSDICKRWVPEPS